MYEPINQATGWFFDSYTSNAGLLIHVKSIIATIKTKLQKAQIIDTEEFGKILVLNNYMYQAQQGTELTEMLVHVPFNSGNPKKKVLLIGGGDGISLSQIVKYPGIEKIDVVDIDEELTHFCQKNYIVDKEIWNDPRAHYHFIDGFDFLSRTSEKYDAILSAVSEIYTEDGSPGMAYKLYSKEFYKLAADHLSLGGAFVSDGTTLHYTSPGYQWWSFGKDMQGVFKIVKPFHFNSKRMPGGEFVLLYCSNNVDPESDARESKLDLKTSYYNFDIHLASFKLPESMKQKWF